MNDEEKTGLEQEPDDLWGDLVEVSAAPQPESAPEAAPWQEPAAPPEQDFSPEAEPLSESEPSNPDDDFWQEFLPEDWKPLPEETPAPDEPEKPWEPKLTQEEDHLFYEFTDRGRREHEKDRIHRENPEYRETLSEYDDDFELDSAEKSRSPIRRDTSRRTGCIGGVLYFLFVAGVSLLLAVFGWQAAVDVLAIGKPDSTIEVTVPENFQLEDIATILRNRGLIRYKFLFSLYGKYSKADTKIEPGTYLLNTNFDYRALVNGMTHRRGVRTEVTVTIPEGYTLQQMFALMEEKGVCSQEELWTAAAEHDFEYSFLEKSTLGQKNRLEGFLFPDTYNFYVGDDAERAINKMLSNFASKFKGDLVSRANEMGLTVREVVTVASMIEKEAAGDFERTRIAAVIYNRLVDPENYPYLEIDATIYYGAALENKEFSLELDSPYNSYTHEGMIPGPISNPGLASIEAALYPDETDEYYYALSVTGGHRFFHDLESFMAFLDSEEYAYHKSGEESSSSAGS